MSLPTLTVHGPTLGFVRGDATITWRARLPVHYPRPAVLSAALPPPTTDLDELSPLTDPVFLPPLRYDDPSVHRGLTQLVAVAAPSLALLKSHLGCPTDTGLVIHFPNTDDRYHRYKWLLYNPT